MDAGFIACVTFGAQKKRGLAGSTVGRHSGSVAKQAVVSLFRSKAKSPLVRALTCFWCPEEDSNLHTLRHTDLNRARLPIPPSGQCNLLKARNLIVKGHIVNEKEK